MEPADHQTKASTSRLIHSFDIDFGIKNEPGFDWVFSAAPNPDGSGYYLVELNRGVFEMSSEGGIVREVGRPSGLEVYEPKRIERIQGGYILEYSTSKFVRLNDEFQPWTRAQVSPFLDLRRTNIFDDHNNRFGSAFQWTYLDTTDQLLVLGDVELNDETWEPRCMLVPFGDPEAFRLVEASPISEELRYSYLMGYPYLVSGLAEDGSEQVLCLLSKEIGGKELAYIGRLELEGRKARLVEVPDSDKLLGNRREIPKLAAQKFSSVSDMYDFLGENLNVGGLLADGLTGAVIYDPESPKAHRWSVRIRGSDRPKASVKETGLHLEASQLLLVMNQRRGQLAIVTKGPILPAPDRDWRQDLDAVAEVPLSALFDPKVDAIRFVQQRIP